MGIVELRQRVAVLSRKVNTMQCQIIRWRKLAGGRPKRRLK